MNVSFPVLISSNSGVFCHSAAFGPGPQSPLSSLISAASAHGAYMFR